MGGAIVAEKRDYYEVLGVSKNATEDEIKKAYRKAAKANHPDLHPDDKQAEARFKEINEAYEVLSDSNKRARYDQFGFNDPTMAQRALAIYSISSLTARAAAGADARATAPSAARICAMILP